MHGAHPSLRTRDRCMLRWLRNCRQITTNVLVSLSHLREGHERTVAPLAEERVAKLLLGCLETEPGDARMPVVQDVVANIPAD